MNNSKLIYIQISSLNDYHSVQDFLVELLNASKSRLKKYLDKKFLNKKVCSREVLTVPIDLVNDLIINPIYHGPYVPIVYEDESFLVLNKPQQIFVHPLTYSESNNCLSFMREKGFTFLNVNTSSYDRGLLYRLDYETSGVLVYVKKNELYDKLRNEFHLLAKKKIYLAKVSGNFSFQGEIVHFLKPSLKNGMKMQAFTDEFIDGQKASMEVSLLKFDEVNNTSLIQVKLKTGHRHQIRVQLSALGFPIVGDPLYGGAPSERLYLHAHNYVINSMGKEYSFVAEPSDF